MKTLKSKTILVLGGAGFIGTNFINHISNKLKNVNLINLDKLTYAGLNPYPKNLNPQTKYVFKKGDISKISELEKVFKKYSPDHVVNFAAETHVDRSIHGSTKEFMHTNIEGVFNILELVRKNKFVKKFLQVSTDEVYGSLPLVGLKKFKESDLLLPNSPYAASKAAGDMLCRSYFSTWKVPVVVSRSSNNYGPFQYPEKLIPFFVTRVYEGKKIPIYGNGKNIRDWTYVYDNCVALELCLFQGKIGEIYNVGSGEEKTNLEIAKTILKYFNYDNSIISFVADRLGHDLRYALDSSKIRKELCWRPKYNFKNAFFSTIDWYADSKNSWMKQFRKKEFNKHIKFSK